MEIETTRGEKKIWLQFERLMENNGFIEEVKRIRIQLDIPVGGVKPTKKNIEHFNILDNKKIELHQPIDKDILFIRTLRKERKKLLSLLPINNPYLSTLTNYYIIFNKLLFSEVKNLRGSFQYSNVCEIDDAQREFDEYSPNDDPDSSPRYNDAYIEMLEEKLFYYPIVLRIHPEAGQRDIIEYIKKQWPRIKSFQDNYIDKTRVASFKNSKTKENLRIKERNNFIYKNKDSSRKAIMQRVNKELNADLDPGAIGKIISLEKKRREKK